MILKQVRAVVRPVLAVEGTCYEQAVDGTAGMQD